MGATPNPVAGGLAFLDAVLPGNDEKIELNTAVYLVSHFKKVGTVVHTATSYSNFKWEITSQAMKPCNGKGTDCESALQQFASHPVKGDGDIPLPPGGTPTTP